MRPFFFSAPALVRRLPSALSRLLNVLDEVGPIFGV